MSTESIDERIARAEHLVAKCGEIAQRYRLDAQAQERRGKMDKASDFHVRADRQECLMRGHQATVERLKGQLRGKVGRDAYGTALKDKANAEKVSRPRPDPLAVYTEAMQHVAELEREVEDLKAKAASYDRQGDTRRRDLVLGKASIREGYIPDWIKAAEAEIASSGRDLKQEFINELTRRARRDRKDTDHSEEFGRLGVETDKRTAAGQRMYVAPTTRGAEHVASMASYRELITREQDRTKARLEAMSRFDNLCSTAEQGLFPELSMETSGRSGGSPGPNVMHSRVAGLADIQEIEEVVGAQNVAMLRAWIYEQKTMTQLSREGYGTGRTVQALALAALDSLVTYWRTMSALEARWKGEQTAGRVSA